MADPELMVFSFVFDGTSMAVCPNKLGQRLAINGAVMTPFCKAVRAVMSAPPESSVIFPDTTAFAKLNKDDGRRASEKMQRR
jgi:hypothetical protein